MPAMALLDNDGVYGAARFSFGGAENWDKSAYWGGNNGQKSDIRRQTSEDRRQKAESRKKPRADVCPSRTRRNRTGYQNLCRLITVDETACAEACETW
jgi:DNA polymerase III alpha subunit